MDTCKNLEEYTGNNDCKENDEVYKVLNSFSLFSKQSYRFYSTETYLENAETLSSYFAGTVLPLSNQVIQHKAMDVSAIKTEFQNNYLYYDMLFSSFTPIETYTATLSNTWTYPVGELSLANLPFPRNCMVSYTYHQSQYGYKATA